MGYAEGNTHGFTQAEAKMEEMEFLFDDLSTKVEEILDRENADAYTRKNWEKIKSQLTPHFEYIPYNWHTDKYGNEVCDEMEEIVSCAGTYEDEIADICWLAGFCLTTTQDWVDGSPEYSIYLPDSFEQAEQNRQDAEKWWNEVYN